MRWIVLVVVAGCGLSAKDFQGALNDATCEYLVRCGLFATQADCTAYFDRTAIDNPSTQAAVDKDKLTYDEDAAHACLDAVAALSCDQAALAGHELDICDDVFTGTLGDGESCGFSGECESNNCVKPACTMACCLGTCMPPRTLPGAGQPCTALCAEGAYCGVDMVCHALLPAGATCDTADACALGLYCSQTSALCTALPHVGEPCESVCAELGSTCTGTCVEVGVLGDPCTRDSDCSQYYACDGSHCVQYPTLGMACTTTCSDASWCNTNTMKCEAQKASGAMCTYNDECNTHFCQRNTCTDVPLCI